MSLTNSPFWMSSVDSGFYSYEVDQSLRFSAASGHYLTRTPTANGNRQTWTLSFWLKIGRIPTSDVGIFGSGTNGSNYFQVGFASNNRLVFEQVSGGSNTWLLRTTRRFRDIGSWYHIVIRYDSTQGTASNRIRIYVNGEQITAFDNNTYPSQNANSVW